MLTVYGLDRAHFDGNVFVPDEPVSLPADSAVRLLVAPDVDGRRPLLELARALEGLPDDPDWPIDGAAEHDHYLYGTPKRNGGESGQAFWDNDIDDKVWDVQ